jgi:hypothetical protein
MKQQEVFKKIGGIIKELNDQYEYLKTVPGQLNELELELFLANSHFLTDHLIVLSKLNSQTAPATATENSKTETTIPAPKPEARQEEKYFEPLVQAIAPPIAKHVTDNNRFGDGIDLGAGSEKDNYSYIRPDEPDTIRHELILDEADTWDDEDEPEDTNKQVLAADEEEVVIPPVVEKFGPKAEGPVKGNKEIPEPAAPAEEKIITINQKILAQLGEKTGIAEQLVPQTISDLKSAINLNDKLLYVKDLFNGYSLAYSEAIEILNRFSSFSEAELFLKKNYVAKNNWEGKPETSAKFYALLRRRYA